MSKLFCRDETDTKGTANNRAKKHTVFTTVTPKITVEFILCEQNHGGGGDDKRNDKNE